MAFGCLPSRSAIWSESSRSSSHRRATSPSPGGSDATNASSVSCSSTSPVKSSPARAVDLDQLELAPALLVPARAHEADHLVHDHAERPAAVAVLAGLELPPQALADELGDVVADRAAHLRDAARDDRLDPAGEEEVDLPVLQQSVVLGISRIAHRGVSQLGHAAILRTATGPARPDAGPGFDTRRLSSCCQRTSGLKAPRYPTPAWLTDIAIRVAGAHPSPSRERSGLSTPTRG